MAHRAFHVFILLGFLAAIGMAVLTLLTPLLAEDGESNSAVLWKSAALGAAAAAVLALDWLVHHMGR